MKYNVGDKVYPIFTKNDLQSGDFLVRRYGSVEMFVQTEGYSALVCKNGGWNTIDIINNDLTCTDYRREYDVIKVYRPDPDKKHTCCFNNYQQGLVVFDETTNRSTTMTVGEIEKELGITNLKIVK